MAGFRLERVLRLRGQLCRLRRLELQLIEGEQERLRDARAAVERERGEVLEGLDRLGSGSGVEVERYQTARAYEEVLVERAGALDRGIAEARARLATQREVLARERREERKLEFLAERHRVAAEVEAALVTERLLDELMLARHAREASGGDGRGA